MIILVDFNNEAILSADKFHVNNMLSIQRHAFVIDALEKYERSQYQNANTPNNIVKSSIYSLFRQIRSNFNKVNPEKAKEVLELLKSKNYDKMLEAFYLIDDWLFDSGATQFVRIKDYDPTDPLAEDEAFGL